MQSEERERLIHDLRMRGWSRIEAENEADDRAERNSAILERNGHAEGEG